MVSGNAIPHLEGEEGYGMSLLGGEGGRKRGTKGEQ